MKPTHLFALLVAIAPAPVFASPAGNEAAARSSVVDVLGGGRFELVGRLFDPGYVLHSDGRDFALGAVEAGMRDLRAAFPDLTLRVDRAVATGDDVAIHWTGSGTNSVRAGGFPGAGRRVAFAGMSFLRFQGGRMVEEWALIDNLALRRQLDLLPGR